jgi:tetratricopeptide (TPR) repeat protein
MVCPRIARCAWGAAVAAALAGTALAQTDDCIARLMEGKRLRSLDRFAEARTLYLNLLTDVRKDSFSQERCEALIENELGLDEQDRGDYGAAETAFNHGLTALPAGSANDSLFISLQTHLAELYIAEARPQDAEPILRRILSAARSSARSESIAVVSEDLAVVCILQRKFAEPEAILRESQVLIEKDYGPNDPRLTSGLLTYAGFLVTQKRYADAILTAEHAWQIISSSPVPISKAYLASALSVLAAVYFHGGRMDEAQNYARCSVEIADAALGQYHPRLGLYLRNYAAILKAAGRRNEAKAIQKRAEEIKQQAPSPASGGYTVNLAALH